MVTSVATVAADLIRSSAFVDGRWVDADGGETFPVVNPATGETIVEVPRLGAPETRRAIEAAERALPAWKARTAKERARILTRLATVGTSATWRGWGSTPWTLLRPVDAPTTRRPRPQGVESARVC